MGERGGRGDRVRGEALLPLSVCLALALAQWGPRLVSGAAGVPHPLAATLTVCASGCEYTRIRDALSAANAGDIISVGAGTYKETLTIPLSVTLTGAGARNTIIDGNKGGTVVTVNAGATVAISGVIIQNGLTSGNGGGIYIASGGALTLTNSMVSGNVSYNIAGGGGGLYNAGTLTLTDSTLSVNAVYNGSGGGLYNVGTLMLTDSTISSNKASGYGGGGIFNSGTLTLTSSTVATNTASFCGFGCGNIAFGGGIDNQGGKLTLTNSTLSGNTASGGYGGGIYNYQGTLALTSSTVSGNTANPGAGVVAGGGLDEVNVLGNTLTLTDTIVAGNSAGDGLGADCSGHLNSGDYNLIQDIAGCNIVTAAHDITGTDPLLGPLRDNGGPTLTMALLPGSPAIDVIPLGNLGGLTTDQRGQPRPDSGEALGDIGAFEVQDTPIPTNTPIDTATDTPTNTPTLTPADTLTATATPSAQPTATLTPGVRTNTPAPPTSTSPPPSNPPTGTPIPPTALPATSVPPTATATVVPGCTPPHGKHTLRLSAAGKVRSGTVLTARASFAARNVPVALRLQVLRVSRVIIKVRGKILIRTRTRVLYSVQAKGTTNDCGTYQGRLRVTYRVKKAVVAMLTLQVGRGKHLATATARVTIQPANRVTPKPKWTIHGRVSAIRL